MKTLLTLSMMALMLAFVACGGGDASHDADHHADSATTETAAEHQNPAETAAVGEGETRLVGTLGCGHCTYHVGDGCSAAIQTAEGGIYILDVAEDSEYFQDRFSGKQLEVVGKISEKGDPKRVEVTSVSVM